MECRQNISNSCELAPIDDEMALIACLTLANTDLNQIARIVSQDDLLSPLARKVYQIALDLKGRGCRPTDQELCAEVSDLKDPAVSDYVALAWDALDTLQQHCGRYWAERIRSRSDREKVLCVLAETRSCLDRGEDPRVALEAARYGLFRHRPSPSIVHLSDLLQGRLEAAQASKDGGGLIGLTSGYSCIDEYTGGLEPGEIYVLGGQTGVGKSSLALSIAVKVAEQGQRVLYFSPEMSADLITDRIIMSRAAIDGQRFRTGQLNHTEWAQVVQASADLSSFLDRVLVVNEVCGTQELTAITREVMPVGLVVVDHIHLIALTEQGDNLTTKTTHASRQLKKMAMDLEVPVLSICQFNRTVKEGEPPKLDGLRDSGALAHDAGTVLLIHSSPGERERPILIVAKNRSGPTGEITALRWHPSYASFSEVNSRELSS